MKKKIDAKEITTNMQVPSQSLGNSYLGKTFHFIIEHDVTWYEISFWSPRISCFSCVSSQALDHTQSIH